ncbi:hypothetical protein EAI_03081, partial [Harpegnathos saltator]
VSVSYCVRFSLCPIATTICPFPTVSVCYCVRLSLCPFLTVSFSYCVRLSLCLFHSTCCVRFILCTSETL